MMKSSKDEPQTIKDREWKENDESCCGKQRRDGVWWCFIPHPFPFFYPATSRRQQLKTGLNQHRYHDGTAAGAMQLPSALRRGMFMPRVRKLVDVLDKSRRFRPTLNQRQKTQPRRETEKWVRVSRQAEKTSERQTNATPTARISPQPTFHESNAVR